MSLGKALCGIPPTCCGIQMACNFKIIDLPSVISFCDTALSCDKYDWLLIKILLKHHSDCDFLVVDGTYTKKNFNLFSCGLLYVVLKFFLHETVIKTVVLLHMVYVETHNIEYFILSVMHAAFICLSGVFDIFCLKLCRK